MSNSPIKIKTSELFKRVSEKNKSEAELQREKNIQQRDAFIASFMKDPEFAEAVESIGLFNKENINIEENLNKSKERKKNKDSTFEISGNISSEQRKSLRLLNKKPVFTEDDLVDEPTFKRKKYDSGYEDLEEVIYKPKKARVQIRHARRPPIVPVSDVTDEMINKIAKKVSLKRYSEIGTSCHQCRQKTIDQKTCCRNVECIGGRGQFCGVCLENRYGEDAAKALRDPNWNCPVCRNICNCSFCRAKAGKRPTGILTPLAHQAGHKSVKEFLESLKGKGDYADEHDDPKNLIGFTEDLKYAQMGDGMKYHLEFTDKELVEKLEETLNTS